MGGAGSALEERLDRDAADRGVEHLDPMGLVPFSSADLSIAAATCIRQPGLAVTRSRAPVETMLAALRSPSSRAGSGLTML
jgi:hypothetical protein